MPAAGQGGAAFDTLVGRGYWLGLALIVGCALALRLLWLDADAATTLTWSGAVYTDEGLYAHAARSQLLTGQPPNDSWDNRMASPLHDALALVQFRVFGIGYVQLRLVSVALSMGALVALAELLRPDLGPRAALTGALLWGLDYAWFQFSRLGLLEPGMVFWMVVAAWCWRRALDRSIGWAVLAGLGAALACVWKSLALLFLPAPLVALLIVAHPRPGTTPRSRVAAGYLIGLAACGLAYLLLWGLPHAAELAVYNRFYAGDRVPASPGALGRALSANLRSRFVWGQTPVLLLAALPGLFLALRAWRRRSLPPVAALCLAWSVCGAALLALPYSPPRYYMLLLPPLIGSICFWLFRADNHCFLTQRSMLALVVGGSLAWSGWWYARWATERASTLPESSRALGALVPPGEPVFGISACALSLENRLPCVPPIGGLANAVDPRELGIRYVLVEDNPADFMRRSYMAQLRRATPLARLPFGPQQVTLYRLAAE